MRIRLAALTVCLMSLMGCAPPAKDAPPLQTVDDVDLERYLGSWYEIARLPHRFQEGCVASKATYSFRNDGLIDVYNECRKGGVEGPLKSVKGKARVVDTTSNAKLEVSFFWPFWGDYWIIDLDPDYQWAVVGHPSRKYLWILSRTETLSSDIFEGIKQRLERQGYDLISLVVPR